MLSIGLISLDSWSYIKPWAENARNREIGASPLKVCLAKCENGTIFEEDYAWTGARES